MGKIWNLTGLGTRVALLCAAFAMAGCSTPYQPAVYVKGSSSFQGIADVLHASDGKPVDVVIVHGMCTHDLSWANQEISSLASAVDSTIPAPSTSAAVGPIAAPGPGHIQLVTRDVALHAGTIRFTAVVWSGLTKSLKDQLDYDLTKTPTDCSQDLECRPKRAKLNGEFKDQILDDCLSDVLAYQGKSHDAIRQAIVESLISVQAHSADPLAPLVLVVDSLGSKIVFDALSSMVPDSPDSGADLQHSISTRPAVIFMRANQLALLSLADQSIGTTGPPTQSEGVDSLSVLLRLRRAHGLGNRLTLVGFTDPNDLLSFRLLSSRYQGQGAALADVLVSNDKTWLGLFENPYTHTEYGSNQDVVKAIACGHDPSPYCR